MVRLGCEPGTAGWKAQTYPLCFFGPQLSYGGPICFICWAYSRNPNFSEILFTPLIDHN